MQITFIISETTYTLDARIVANHRAKYYADKEGTVENYRTIFNAIRDETLEDKEELLDWLQNNMSWDDIKDHVHVIKVAFPVFNWSDAHNFEVI